MRRLFIGGMLAASLWATAAPRPVQAGDFWGNCKQIFHLNMAWPAPYVQQDRASVTAHFAAMTDAGWKTQNMMCEYHFAPNGEKLNVAGEMRLKWILTQAPPQHRLVFVQKAGTPEETRARVDAVQIVAQQIQGSLANVSESDLETPGRPAEQVDVINRAALDGMPAPVLPAGKTGGTTAGSTSAGSISQGGGSGGR